MDGHSKNVFLIGILYMLGYIMFSLEPLTRAIKLLNADDDADEELSFNGPAFSLSLVAYSVLMAILAGLMIRGVLKKRHILVAPFLVANSLVFTAAVVLFLTHLVLKHKIYFFYVEDSLCSIGVQIMVLYPVYTLFSKLRSQSLQKKSLENTFCQYEKSTDDVLTKKLYVS